MTNRIASRGFSRWGLLCAFAVGGGVACGVLLLGLWSYGTVGLCAKGLVCELAGYRNVGAARGIHLVGSRDPYHGFTVVWETPNRQAPPRVEYRPVGGTQWDVARGISTAGPRNGVVAADGFVHSVEVTGLQPATDYEYRVSWDARAQDRKFSEAYVARTLDTGEPLRLAFLADICLSGRPDGRSGPLASLMADLQSADVDMILGGGDYACALDDGRYPTAPEAVRRFFDEWQPVLARVPFVGQYGNHECCHGEWPELWDARLALGFASSRTPDGRSFALQLGQAQIIGLYATGASGALPQTHLSWLREVLEGARADGRWPVLVYQHAPLFGSGTTHPPEPALRRQLVPLLEDAGVTLHLSGHDMAYERTLPITGGAESPIVGHAAQAPPQRGWNGVVYAKVSPAGRRAANPGLPKNVPPYMAMTEAARFVYAIVTIEPGRSLAFEVRAFDAEGRSTIIDRFSTAR